MIFSLDLYDGIPLGDAVQWNQASAETIVEKVVTIGISRIIILDLSKIGTETGLPMLELCRNLRAQYPELEITLGGGIQTEDDLKEAEEAGANCVLVATALHTGTLKKTSIPE